MMEKSRIFFLALLGLVFSPTLFGQKYGKTPEDSIKCIENTSVYQEFFKQKNYADCYEPWRNVLNYCPKSSLNVYIRGVTILRYMIDNSKEANLKTKYINELYELYELRSKNFSDIAENKARKAIEMRNYTPDSVETIYHLLRDAIEMPKGDMEPVYIYVYFVSTLDYVKAGKNDASLIIENYDKATSLLEPMIQKKPDKKEEIENYLANIEAAFSPYASCEQLVEIFTKKFQETPDDLNLLKKITSLLDSKKCTDQELFFLASEKLHQLEPTPKTAYLMGRLSYDKKQYSKAVSYFKEATEKLQDSRDLYNAYLLLASTYSSLNQYANARAAAYKAAEADPSKGQPYLIIASLYAQSASSCGSGPVYGRVAYWAAVDKCVKAKSVDSDPDVVSKANNMINTYSAYFPDKGEAFMESLEDGMSYTIPCWIGETTVVRTRK